MRRVAPAWVLGLPLVLIGWLSAHAVAYELVTVDARERERLLASSGHGYLEHAQVLAAACVALAAFGFFLRARGRGAGPTPAWALGVLPVVGFSVQETVERALHGGGLPWETALEPVFLVGLALQLPFALVALLVGRALTGLADAVAASDPPRPRLAPTAEAPLPRAPERRPLGALAAGHAGRAPPLQA